MKICNSRKSTESIMKNGGFGLLVIKRGNTSVLVPEQWLFSDGRIKKYARTKIDDMFKKAEIFNNAEVCM